MVHWQDLLGLKAENLHKMSLKQLFFLANINIVNHSN